MTETLKKDRVDISVIVPVYNSVNYLRECVNSLVSDVNVSYEVILVDDGSDDGSSELCDELCTRYRTISVIHTENRGAGNARNTGLEAAEGKYFIFVDSDDEACPGMLDTLFQDAEENGTEAVFCGFSEIYGESGIIEHTPSLKGPADRKAAMRSVLSGIGNGYFTSIWNKLFLREPVVSRKLLFGSYIIGEDELWLCETMSVLERFYLEPRPLYRWRRHGGSLLSMRSDSEAWRSALKAKMKCLEVLDGDPELEELMRAKLYNNCFEGVCSVYGAGDRAGSKELLSEIRTYLGSFLKSRTISLGRKAKCMMLKAMMSVNASPDHIERLISIKRVKEGTNGGSRAQ